MIIDLRSDTVTKPTPAMLAAMFNAEVGDDVFNEDPTVNNLQEKAAKMFGKESAIYVPSGTMSNQIAIKIHTQPGDEVICDKTAHIYNFEGGGIAFNSGCSVKLIDGDNGRVTAGQVLECINPKDIHHAQTKLVSLENTSNKGGGSCFELTEMQKIAGVCKQNNLKYHLDGARIFNAIVKKGYTSQQIGNIFDSISICLSKGLGAPVGSILIGDKDFITQARRYRKLLGGAMRQAGYIAAAGIYALDHHIERLAQDHQKAQEIVKMLEKMPYVEEILPTETNIVIFKLSKHISEKDFLKKIAALNLLAVGFGPQTVRLVTHLDITDEMMGMVEERLKRVS
jgi:threonine aldolase